METSHKSHQKSDKSGVFIFVVLTVSFFSFTPDKYLNLLFNPGSEFCPVGSAFLEPAFQNSLYSDSIRWTPPVDTTISTPFGPITIPYDSFEVVQVTGLPAGISFQCDDSNCIWIASPPNATIAFIKLNGNPGNSPAGKYKIKVEVKYFVTTPFTGIQSFTETDSSLCIQLCPFPNSSTNLEVIQVGTTLSLGSGLNDGYYLGTNGVTGTGTIDGLRDILFLSEKEVLLEPNFEVNFTATFTSGICPL
jgi:hypothetical protein